MASSFKQKPAALTATTNSGSKNGRIVQVTTESLSSAAAATYTFTLTNIVAAVNSAATATVGYASGSGGMPVVTSVTPGAGTVVVIIKNIHATDALSGTLLITVVLY